MEGQAWTPRSRHTRGRRVERWPGCVDIGWRTVYHACAEISWAAGMWLRPQKGDVSLCPAQLRNVGSVQTQECRSVLYRSPTRWEGGWLRRRAESCLDSLSPLPTHPTCLEEAWLLGNAPGGETLLWPPSQSSPVCFKLTLIFRFLCRAACWRGLFRAMGSWDPAASSQASCVV